jgi:hypothetical protein
MAVEVEIKDDATREDVNAMVKEFMEERAELASEKAGEKVGEDDTSKQTRAGDDDSADDDAAAEAGSEDSGEDENSGSQKKSWLTDEIRAELPRWISDDDLSEFSSRDELDRALGLMDRAALKAGRDAGTKGGEEDQDAGSTKQRGQERGQDGKFVKQKKREEAKGDDDSSQSFEIELDLSEYDDGLQDKIKGALTGLRDHYEGRMKALDDRFNAIEEANESRQAAAIEAQFDAIVDSLGHADLFGQSGEETDKQLEARRKLFDEHHVYLTGLKALGREGRMDKASVARVLRMAFADHISKQEQKNLTKRFQKQSNMRMGVGAERPAEQPFAGPLTRHPEIVRLYKELREARGEE